MPLTESQLFIPDNREDSLLLSQVVRMSNLNLSLFKHHVGENSKKHFNEERIFFSMGYFSLEVGGTLPQTR